MREGKKGKEEVKKWRKRREEKEWINTLTWPFDKLTLRLNEILSQKSDAFSCFPFGLIKLTFILMFLIKQKPSAKQEGEADASHFNDSHRFLEISANLNTSQTRLEHRRRPMLPPSG